MTAPALHVFLDTNVVSYLIEWNQANVAPIRDRLLGATKAGLVRVEGSLEVYSELTGTIRSRPDLFREVVGLLREVVGRCWMVPFSERHVLEVQHGGRLPDEELHLPEEVRRGLDEFAGQDASVRGVAAEVGERAQEHKDVAQATRDAVVVRLKEESRDTDDDEISDEAIRRAIWRWYSDKIVDDWTRDMLESGVERGLFSESTEGWPDPRAIAPSLWAYVSYRLVRIALEVGDRRKILPSDEYDARHYSAAAVYTDVLVTEDKNFRRAVEMIPSRSVEVVGLLEFDGRLKSLVGQSGSGPDGR